MGIRYGSDHIWTLGGGVECLVHWSNAQDIKGKKGIQVLLDFVCGSLFC